MRVSESLGHLSVSLYQPVTGGSPGQYDAPEVFQVVENTTYYLPSAHEDKTPAGLEFVGWIAASPKSLTTYVAQPDKKLLEAGTAYTVTDNVCFTAQGDCPWLPLLLLLLTPSSTFIA